MRKGWNHPNIAVLASWHAIVLLLMALWPTWCRADIAPKAITVVFRYDDPSAKTNTDIEGQLIAAFRQYNMCCTFAVIPFVVRDVHDPKPQEYLPLPEERAQLFAGAAREGVLEIAQHGYSHQTNGLQAEGYSEFAGLKYEEQVQKIKKGKEFLEQKLGMPVLTFVPPWNSYDVDTLRALEQTGFQCLSSNRQGFSVSRLMQQGQQAHRTRYGSCPQ